MESKACISVFICVISPLFIDICIFFIRENFLVLIMAYNVTASTDIGSKGVARIINSGIDGSGSLCRTISSSELSKQGKPGSLFHGNLLNCIDDWLKLVYHGEV